MFPPRLFWLHLFGQCQKGSLLDCARDGLMMGTIFRAGIVTRKRGITPMDNFVCWRCEHEARGAFMLMGRPAEKWLVRNQYQMALELRAR
jgi:hypothetical protein